MLAEMRALYTYSSWATRRILDTADRLGLKQFIASNGGAGSIREILAHTASAQWTWLGRWQGAAPRPHWDAAEFPSVASLRARWIGVEEETHDFLAGLEEGDLARDISYVNFKGESWRYPLWQAMLHQANHATQHRSEAALLLTQCGSSPGDLDFLRYFDEQDAG